jgi:hypothetical protein
MNVLQVTADQIRFEPVGNEDKGPADTVLHGQLVLAGCSCHVEAIQVKDVGNGVLRAVNDEYDSEVEALYQLSGNSLTTAAINGKNYLLAVVPHSA